MTDMNKIHKDYKIESPPENVWRALTDPDEIDGWGGGPVTMAAEINFEFSMWGGDVFGRNKEVVPDKRLVQEWYNGDWREPSLVTFTLTPEGSGTLLELIHENIPPEEVDDIDTGWDDFYLGPLKEYVESS